MLIGPDHDAMRLDYLYQLVMKEVEDERRQVEQQQNQKKR